MVASLTEIAHNVDDVTMKARAQLVSAVRGAAAAGMTQAQIATAINRSQPEVSRLLRFHGTSPLARRLRKKARQIRAILAEVGGSNLRVFGSVATGNDSDGSDIDLLFTMGAPLSLMQLVSLENQISQLVEAEVDLVPEKYFTTAHSPQCSFPGSAAMSRSPVDTPVITERIQLELASHCEG